MSRVSIEISGNLLSESLLDSLAEEESKHIFAKPESFRWYKYDITDSKSMHLSRIAEAYDNLKARWDMLSASFQELNISDLRDKWIKYLFAQLGYNLDYQKADVVADSGNKFYLSHRGWDGEHAPIVHTVLFNQDLDSKPDDGRHRYSPHDTLQRYLNQSNKDSWGITTNGRELRLLRDFHHETRKAYIKFDLEAIFEGRNYNDFRLLWRLIHPSRFIADGDNKSVLEALFDESKNAGVAIGENLQKNIRLAIESLSNGFLLSTPGLIDSLVDNNEKSLQFYQQILRVVYRILFLFYAEQRKLMPTRSALYAREYSLTSLREKVELKQAIDTHHTDLWEGLKVTFEMVHKGVPELGITAFNGQLFDSENIKTLSKTCCRNDKLLEAIRYMSIFEQEGIRHRISYVELSVDEIGAIYESLLEYIPRVSSKEEVFEDALSGNRRNRERKIPPRTFFLDPRGTNRKTSGSYYTNPGLVNALIESALVPVLEEKLKTAGPNKDAQEEALLSLKVCDPACGSAAFLIAATEYLGGRLAKIRTQSDYPSDMVIRHARRDVLRHCIYGVDINPMSVELAKVSLWLTAATDDQPLNFLDHRIKCGNSLIGATPELINKGIPPEAYSPVEGDDKALANKRKKSAKEYYKRKDRERNQIVIREIMSGQYGFQEEKIKDLPIMFEENSPYGIKQIEASYKKSREKEQFLRDKFMADYWTSAFFWPHDNDNEIYPDPEGLEYLINNKDIQVTAVLKDKINQIAQNYQFFHWHLEFPEVFAKGGFDCVLGNPPWEKITFEDKIFFSERCSEIANASSKHKRKQLIKKLSNTNYSLYSEYKKEKECHEKQSIYFRNSKIFPYTGVSRINLYSLFSELLIYLLNSNGSAGIIVPSGIITDDNNKNFFNYLLNNKNILSVFDFVNKEGIFPNVHRSYKFSLFTITKKNICDEILLSFNNPSIENLNNKDKQLKLSKKDIYLINPNTKNCPVFKDREDGEIAKRVYSKTPVLFQENNCTRNGWEITIKTPFNTANDSMFFKSAQELKNLGYKNEGVFFVKEEEKFVPLYEGKMIWISNHRASSVKYQGGFVPGRHDTVEISDEELKHPNFFAIPRLWISEKIVHKRYPNRIGYNISFRDITNSYSERTAIFSIVPNYGLVDTIPMVVIKNEERYLLFANFITIIFDFFARQKVGGNHLNFYILKQLPVISLESYSEGIKKFIKDRILELVYVSYDVKGFAEDLGYSGDPFMWNSERRLILQSDLDALYSHLYELSEKDIDHILETFPIVKRRDIERYGEYRTKRLILEKYEELKPMFK